MRYITQTICTYTYALLFLSIGMIAGTATLAEEQTMAQDLIFEHRDMGMVGLADGRNIKHGDTPLLLADANNKNIAATSNPHASILTTKPATTGRKVKDKYDLAEALKLPESETVVLPSGRRATVGQIKFVRKQVEKKLGRSLTAVPVRPNLDAAAIKVNKRTDWKAILQKPDKTVLESPDGIRVTVGELKQMLIKRKTVRQPGMPGKH